MSKKVDIAVALAKAGHVDLAKEIIAKEDPWDVIADMIDNGPKFAKGYLRKEYEMLVKAFEKAKKQQDGYKKIGVGVTESANLMKTVLLPAVQSFYDEAEDMLDKIKDALKDAK